MREKVHAGTSALEIPFIPRWIVGQEGMDHITEEGTKQHLLIYFIVRTEVEPDRLLKQGIHFGGKCHKVEKYRRVRPDTICLTCCH